MPNRNGFFAKNAVVLKSVSRVVFGLVWLVDASLKFQPGFLQNFSSLIAFSARGQPSLISGWFAFWVNATSANPVFWAYVIAFSELAVAVSLIFGFMRKVGYGGGFLLSLLIWSVPEGFGGPYGPSSTDIGTGIIYALVFLMLMVINALEGTSRYSLDYYIEKKVKWWKSLAEFGN
jgi:nitrite reductase (NO-forming)